MVFLDVFQHYRKVHEIYLLKFNPILADTHIYLKLAKKLAHFGAFWCIRAPKWCKVAQNGILDVFHHYRKVPENILLKFDPILTDRHIHLKLAKKIDTCWCILVHLSTKVVQRCAKWHFLDAF